MEATIDYDRQVRLWGEQGQHLIENSSLIIVGADNLGAECAKSAAILGVGNISLVDMQNSTGREKYLDIQLPKGPKVKSLAELINKFLNINSKIVGFSSGVSRSLYELICKIIGKIDCIIDVSNDPASQYENYAFCLERKIPLLVGAANFSKGRISHLYQLSSYDKSRFSIVVPEFNGSIQGTIISNIMAGILMEEFRKNLFISHEGIFNDVKVCMRDGSLKRNDDGSERTYYNEYLRFERLMDSDIQYSLDGLRQQEGACVDSERGLEGRKALILGGGAIGNYVADILARLGLSRADVVDIDRFDRTNLNRQPLAYDGVGRLKAEVLAEKMNSIAGREISSPIIGFVGESCSDSVLKKARLSQSQAELLNACWFKEHKKEYDILFGCFDNLEARLALNSYATQEGLNYIDGGSGGTTPNKCSVNIYAPGRTNCMGCRPYFAITPERARIAREKIEIQDKKRGKAFEDNREIYKGIATVGGGNSCTAEWIEGSINMSNQIAAGIMVSEARKLFDSSLGGLVDSIVYDSQRGSTLSFSRHELRCRCHENE